METPEESINPFAERIEVTRHDAASGERRVFHEDVRGVDDQVFAAVLGETVAVLDAGNVPYVLIGGIASSGFGRPRWTHDIDILVKPDDADRAIDLLARRDFATERTDARWIYKAFKRQVMIDLIFRSTGGIFLDADMLTRAVERVFYGHEVKFIPPEDLLIMKAAAHDEGGPRHWHDAIGILATTPLDWAYLQRRASRAPRRVLSLLVYAHSLDLMVPNRVIRDLFRRIYES